MEFCILLNSSYRLDIYCALLNSSYWNDVYINLEGLVSLTLISLLLVLYLFAGWILIVYLYIFAYYHGSLQYFLTLGFVLSLVLQTEQKNQWNDSHTHSFWWGELLGWEAWAHSPNVVPFYAHVYPIFFFKGFLQLLNGCREHLNTSGKIKCPVWFSVSIRLLHVLNME